jgi:uncharacterized protein GlcG (DUF336 family)
MLRPLTAALASLLAPARAVPDAPASARPPYGMPVDLATATRVMMASMAEATANGWNVAVAIVDTHGFLVCFQRLDDTHTASVQVAIEKARTSAMFRRATKEFEDVLAAGRLAVLGLPGATPFEGGLPLVAGGKVVGGIGVSGALPAQDAQVAEAGSRALA